MYAAADDKHDPAACQVPAERLRTGRGIEVGHIFYFGNNYSKAMGASVTGPGGEDITVEMGSYGIGVSRLVGAIIEAYHDDKGIIWPDPMAPFTVAIIPMGAGKSEAVKNASESLHADLADAGIEVLLDDRGERPGVMLADQELIGIPHRVVIGDRGLKDGVVEYQHRRDAEATRVPLADVAAFVKAKLAR